MQYSTFYNVMPDGTVKQINPFTGNEVWAVPGRGTRPIQNGGKPEEPEPAVDVDPLAVCSFCEKRYFETPPEKSRWVRDGDHWYELAGLPPAEYFSTVAQFRTTPNLFEIVTLDYWRKNYGYHPPAHELDRMESYIAAPGGMDHLREIIDYKLAFSASSKTVPHTLTDDEVIRMSEPFFSGCHELIVGRRHWQPETVGGVAMLESSGTMQPDEHYHYFNATVESMKRIMARNRYVRYVSIFQNWLKPAGASFDHLHKQLVGLDEWGASITRQVKMLKDDPNVFNEYGANFAAMYNLVFAENEHAIAFVGIGHRFPTLEVFSKSFHARPNEHTPEELRGVSDLVHACHAATGTAVSCNEEWYYSPVDAIVKMPWHVLIKWRITVPAGFEGGTSIFINPMTPVELRDRMVPRLYALRDAGAIAPMSIAEECHITPNPLKYYLK
jgi:galactose-1-phosphate uridylyltransferase